MISIKGLDYIKEMAKNQADIIPGGVLYATTDGKEIRWRQSSKEFDLDIFQVGDKLNVDSVAGRAFKENKKITENVPRSLYGIRIKTIAEPIVDDNGNIIGVFSTVLPRMHAVAKAFNDFAPIITEMFPEGSCFILTDLHKLVSVQSSKKFVMPYLKAGDTLKDDFITKKAIEAKKPLMEDLDSSVYGVPVLVTGYPLFDEDNPDEVVATICIVVPKSTASKLREMSKNLQGGLSQISATIQELAASAAQIHTNEQDLNNGIKDIVGMSDEINKVSSFIKEIADETKMLGLNAAIEAARAGEAGRGFGVVAEEIRKLSEQSKSTVPKIQELTNNIKEKVNQSGKKSQSSLSSSQEQAAATEEITASVEEITSSAEELNKIAQGL